MFAPKIAFAAVAASTIALTINPAAAASALTNSNLTLHSGPGAKFMTVGDVGGNSKVGVLWCGGPDFAWCLIQYHAKQGWVSLGDLTAIGGVGSKLATDGTSGKAAAEIAAEAGGESLASRVPHVGPSGGTPVSAGSVGSTGVHAVGGF